MSRSTLTLFLGALIAGQAGYWFLSGAHANHSNFRTGLVFIQALAGFGFMFWAVKNKPGKKTH